MPAIRFSESAIKGNKIGTAKIAGAQVGNPARAARDTSTFTTPAAPAPSLIEQRFAQQIVDAGLPEPVREYFHILGRDFRLDFAWPSLSIGVEVQGGAHRVKGRFSADIEKRALSLLAGWKVLEVNGAAVRDGRGIEWLKQLYGNRIHGDM